MRTPGRELATLGGQWGCEGSGLHRANVPRDKSLPACTKHIRCVVFISDALACTEPILLLATKTIAALIFRGQGECGLWESVPSECIACNTSGSKAYLGILLLNLTQRFYLPTKTPATNCLAGNSTWRARPRDPPCNKAD